jgi:hypothetical protein
MHTSGINRLLFLVAITWLAGGVARSSVLTNENYTTNLGTVVATISFTGGLASGPISWSGSARFTAASASDINLYLGRGCTMQTITSCGVLVLMFWVDGALVGQQVGVADGSITVDTTTLCNGPHEFVTTAWSDEPQSRLIGVSQTIIQVNNGRTPMAVSSGWDEVILSPGQQQSLSPRVLYTNGDRDALSAGIVYAIDSPSIVSVNANGVLTATSNGVATLTTTALGKTATTRIIVDQPIGFPHFGKDGSILDRYDSTRSVILRSVFGITPDEITNDPSLTGAVSSSRINALTSGIYMNPADGGAKDFNTWQTAWDEVWNLNATLARSLGVSIFLTGDDIAREPYELDNSVNNSWSAQAIEHSFSTAQASGLAIGVDMVDEVALLWGDTPTPSDGRWLDLQPPIHDDAFTRVMHIIQTSPARIPVSWPAGGIASDAAVANWDGNPAFADYTSHYWDVQDFRDEYYFGGRSLKQIQKWMGDEALFRRLPYIQRNKPQIALISATGPFYTKLANGGAYTPGVDILQRSGAGPEQIMGEVMFGVVAGMCGFRVYNYDTLDWRNQRATAPIGTKDLQTGIGVNSQQWSALSLSFNFIRQLEPLILQPRISAVDMGADIATTARQGANGTLVIAVNMAEAPRPITANLSPYKSNENITRLTRYRLTINGLATESLQVGLEDRLTIQPGETVAWVFGAAQ